ncbi:FxsA family protein [Mycobacterium haemophilum]|uniref:Exclusion suppressor FxsA n=1 Tax=Mycobacterium haemophilum TaxID=29311 RepID=A0A0I9UVP1_9MYCO|nr:FxsA family protein [Mycobacterium haemophilum]KLO26685.1 exclusion suppressor FxsA [Mycobacterium haemophilum]KLO34805.1 exclusion suppressor FxsA [Mycobacterium haemophilum]KLO39737.1 exclusion suppressor FxsA [Mycobacterium haemophilum]KLO46856.1 exclusion suppressor FxsA [Mycobacterium haemophilum]
MVRRLFLIYAVVELAAILALVSTIGFGWTLWVLLAAVALGWGLLGPVGGWQVSARLVQLRSGLAEPRTAVSDGAVVTAATVLVLVPGLITTALGLLLLIPPIRAVARPGLTALAVRGFQRRVPLVTDMTATGDGSDFIEGEVVDVADVEAPILPQHPTVDPT